jgi:uncharacterized protein YijF (DUF1287 family)
MYAASNGTALMASRSAGMLKWSAVAAAAIALALYASLHAVSAFPAFQANKQTEGNFFRSFVAAALERTRHTVRYDPAYVRIPYPGGDVPATTGVCTDEVIRTYHAVGVDLQKEVHEDMLAHRSAYPRKWAVGRTDGDGTDTNIDHRRVPNLMVFFKRKGQSLPLSAHADEYHPGDLVTWNLGGGITHIGIVVDQKSPESGRYMIVHNIGAGPQMEDVLFQWKIIGHYRYWPASNLG